MREKASPIVKGIEDKFCYAITEDCIGCLRAFSGKGITPRHLVDLLLGLETAPRPCALHRECADRGAGGGRRVRRLPGLGGQPGVTAGSKKGVAEVTPFLFCFGGCGLTPARRHLRG